MKKQLLIFGSIAVVLTFFLAYIDEGNYDFSWMSDPGSWITVFIYIGVLTLLQFFLWGVFRVMGKKINFL